MTAYMRDYRAGQAALTAELRAARRDLVIIAGELRAGCACPAGSQAECPECCGRRARAARLESISGLVGSLARG